jgi:phosphopantetheine adenylyltransferase
MRGIAFDTENRIGSLFFMADSVVGGTISALCMGKTRRKSLEVAVSTINFIQRNYGMDTSSTNMRKAENLNKLLISLKKVLKHEADTPPF